MRTGIEAAEYGAELQRIVRYLGVSNGNMQEGSLRCDVNVSVRPVGQSEFGTKVILISLGLPITVCYSVFLLCLCWQILLLVLLFDDSLVNQLFSKTSLVNQLNTGQINNFCSQ